jgi:hypothetical protein
MTKLQHNHREEIRSVLRLLISKEAQLRYQRAVPFVSVTVELFCQWDACYSPRHNAWFKEMHSPAELAALDEFQRVVVKVRAELPDRLPEISNFVSTPQWQRLALAAAAALGTVENSGDDTAPCEGPSAKG